MSELAPVSMVFIKDFVANKNSRYFIRGDKGFSEVNAVDICKLSNQIVCHDFWMIRDEILKTAGSLPANVFDVEEVYLMISQRRDIRYYRQKELSSKIPKDILSAKDFDVYQSILNKKSSIDNAALELVCAALLSFRVYLLDEAKKNCEYERLTKIELPVFNLVNLHASGGVAIDPERVKIARDEIHLEYYEYLKNFGTEFDIQFEVLNDNHLREFLNNQGFYDEEVSLDFILEYLPLPNCFGEKLQRLRKLKATLTILEDLTLSENDAYPIIEIFGTRTSRILLRNPMLQNLSKRYRNIIVPKPDKNIGYVDYDQFEVGIMAALSEDALLLKLFAEPDMYTAFANEFLKMADFRSQAKSLFLSYAYGMSQKAVIDAAVSLGVTRENAKKAFRSFQRYELWKQERAQEFNATGKMSTLLGNAILGEGKSPYSKKDLRSMISQLVQGTGSLIFKKSLMRVSDELPDVRIILPMHDAILFEYTGLDTPSKVTNVFAEVMTETLSGKVKGKASLSEFF